MAILSLELKILKILNLFSAIGKGGWMGGWVGGWMGELVGGCVCECVCV